MTIVISKTVTSSDLPIIESTTIDGVDVYVHVNDYRDDMFEATNSVDLQVVVSNSRLSASLSDQNYSVVNILASGSEDIIGGGIQNHEYGFGSNADSAPADTDIRWEADFSGSTNVLNKTRNFFTEEDPIEFTDDTILVAVYWHPDVLDETNWEQATSSDEDVILELTEGVNDSYCGGDTAEATFNAKSGVPFGEGSAQLVSNNLITGGSNSTSVTVGPDETKEVTASVDIPENTVVEDEDIISVEVQ